MTAVVPAPSVVSSATRSGLAARVVHSLPELCVCAVAGFAAPAIVALLADHFSPGWVLPLGLAGAVLAVAACGLTTEHVDRRAVRYTLAAVAVALAWLVVNSFFSAQNLFAHRDPATYNLAGRWLMDHARMPIATNPEVFGSPSGASGSSAGFGRVAGGTDLYAQGNHLLPAMLAAVGWLFGTTAMLKANVAFGALALLTFFGLARRIVGPGLALLAMAAFAVSMPLIFVSRDTYSEPLALLFLVGGLSLLHRAIESGRVRDYALAGFVVAMSAPVRIDSDVSLLGVLIAAGVLAMLAAREARRAAVLRCSVLIAAGVVPAVLGWLDVTRLSSGYYHDERHDIIPIIYAGCALAVVLPLLVGVAWHPAVQRLLRSPQLPRRATIAAGVLIGGAFVFLASRPFWMVGHGRYNGTVTAMQQLAGETPDGTRTYNEQTVHWMAQYLGWPTVILAVTGYFLLVRRAIRDRSLVMVATITVGLTMSALYLWSAKITPDQPWAMRRYVPVVLPVMIIAATYALCVPLHRAANLRSSRAALAVRGVAVVLAAAVVAIPAIVTAPVAGLREEVPQLAQVQRICAQVAPHGAVLELDPPAETSYSQTIRSYCNVPSLALINAQPDQLAQTRAAVAAHGRQLFVLATEAKFIPYADGSAPAAPFSQVRTTRWPSTLHGPPTAAVHEQVAVYLATVREDGFAEPVTAAE